jgi:soluble lytic murein transglycosylase
MQVMPATARAPGFGVQPAAAQTPAEYNRVGEQYYGRMLGRYGNDPAKAWAAYHSGPGTVDRLQRTYGAGWQQHLGPEGRDYVSDNLSALRRIQPQAQTPAPLTAQAPAMPSPLDAAVAQSPAQAPDARPTFQTEDEMVKLYRERQANEDKQIALQRTKAELATQALMAKRKGLGAGDWFRLSAALAARTRSRGLGGVLENVSPVLADIADRNEQARTGREQALAQLGYERDKGELDIRAGGFDNRLQMLKAIAERNQPDKGTLGSDGLWHYRDRPQQSKNSITVGGLTYNQWDDGKYRRINADGTRSVFVIEGDQLRQVGTERANGGQ